MARVEWSQGAERDAFGLSPTERRALIKLLDLLRLFPEMGERVLEGHYRGQRRILIGSRWYLYYRVHGTEPVCSLAAIRHARRRPV